MADMQSLAEGKQSSIQNCSYAFSMWSFFRMNPCCFGHKILKTMLVAYRSFGWKCGGWRGKQKSVQALYSSHHLKNSTEETGSLQVLEQKIEEALACPCVEELRNGPCGKQFVGAFSCYVRNFKAESVSVYKKAFISNRKMNRSTGTENPAPKSCHKLMLSCIPAALERSWLLSCQRGVPMNHGSLLQRASILSSHYIGIPGNPSGTNPFKHILYTAAGWLLPKIWGHERLHGKQPGSFP